MEVEREEFVARTLLREELVWLVSKEVTVTERGGRIKEKREKLARSARSKLCFDRVALSLQYRRGEREEVAEAIDCG